MYNFFPEKIYNILKDDPVYIKWDNYANSIKNSYTKSFRHSLISDYNTKRTEVYTDFLKEIGELIDNKCPQYKTQFLLINLDLTKKDLLLLRDNCSYDTETTLFLISQLINTSYIDREFNKYIKEYVELYETISTNNRSTYSAYCNIKYFLLAPEYYMLSKPKDETFLPTMIDYINCLKEEFKDIIDADTLNHCYLQVVEHMIANAMYFLNNDKIIAKNLDELDLQEDTITTQYIDYSCARAGIKDKKFEIYFSNREFGKAFENMKWLFTYIDKALKNPEIFFKGLEYYDKVNNFPMAAIVRRMLKVAEEFPEFRFRLINLSDEDKNFLTQSTVSMSVNTSSHVTDTTFRNFINHMDNWYTGNADMIEIIKARPDYELLVSEIRG